jgi:hypothetical protein
MESHRKLLKSSSAVLERAGREYSAPPTSAAAGEFYQLRLQAAIFNYDVTYSLVALWETNPQGLAEKVALKDLVLKLFEYEHALSSRIVGRVIALADRRGLSLDKDLLKSERKKWKGEFAQIRRWSDIRNEAAGHYGRDIPRQVALLMGLGRSEVHTVAIAFLSFNNKVCKLLGAAGRGK